MRKSILAGVAVLGIFAGVAVTAHADSKEYKGVLIDQKCGAGKDEAGAAGHPKSCTLKCCDKQGLALVQGDKMLKLDDASVSKAKEYLDKNDSTKVVIKGEEKDGKLAVDSIEAQK